MVNKQEHIFEIQSIENGFLLNRISTGDIVPSTKGKVVGQTFFNTHDEMKEIIKNNLFLLPIAEKGKIKKFKIIIEQ